MVLMVSAVPSANAQQRIDVSYRTCLKTQKPASVTTSKGPKDVRKELNRLALEITCRYADLKATHLKEVRRRYAEKDRTNTVFMGCLQQLGITETAWYKRYDMFSGKGPCVKEAMNRFSANSAPSTSFLEWNAHNAWLNSLVLFRNLAMIYPDSVVPRILANYLEQGKTASACIARKQWCYQG